MGTNEFGGNKEFLKFMFLVKTDTKLKKSLINGDLSSIDKFSGLSSPERELLHNINWGKFEINITKELLENFKPSTNPLAFETCQEKWDGNKLTKSCHKS
jgi:hypothetical protein